MSTQGRKENNKKEDKVRKAENKGRKNDAERIPAESERGSEGAEIGPKRGKSRLVSKFGEWKNSITEHSFLQFLRVIMLILLIGLCAVIVATAVNQGGIPAAVTGGAAGALVFSMIMKIFVMRTFPQKIAWYVLDSILLVVLTAAAGWKVSMVYKSSYTYLVYVLVLSEFYLSAPSLRDDAIMFAVNLAVYTAAYAFVAGVQNEFSSAFDISSLYFLALIVLGLDFMVFNFAMALSRKNKLIEQNLKELEESRNELLRAYDKLEEATLIEERNRIAKEIHDTAGHSLTTVIMQTEAAKLALKKDPDQAQRCITAANIQAKNCLDELRLSVHLLSGKRENTTFKEYLEGILDETSSGTYFTVRSKIDDLELTAEAERFISNTLREGISNGIRHGKSTAFFFELKDMGNFIEFLFSDNGQGIDMKKFREGFGLSGMRAKAESLGGMIHFSSEEGEGFEIRLSLPGSVKLKSEKNDSEGESV